jgi:FkbM family methyltransferase
MNWLRQSFYRIIYFAPMNRVLRNLNRMLVPFLPARWRIPPSGVMTVSLNSGSFSFATNQTNATSQLLFWRGSYQMEYTAIFEKLIGHCNCFYDIGAHAGYYSLIAAMVNKKCRIIAFEPAPGPFHYLEKNIHINGFGDRIEPLKVALGDSIGKASFLEAVHSKYQYLEHNLVAVSNLVNKQPNREMKRITVQINTLDNFIQEHSESIPELIKMDTEGTEHMILAGGALTLHHKPIVICETLFHSNERELEEIMKRRGYDFYNYKDGALTKVDSIVRTTDNGVHDCFFVHPDKRHLVQPFVSK